jgi:hypothetical protein
MMREREQKTIIIIIIITFVMMISGALFFGLSTTSIGIASAEPGKNEKCTSLRTEGSKDTAAGWYCTTDKESAELYKDFCNEQRKNDPDTVVEKCSSSQTAYGQQDNFKSKD